MKKMLMLLHCLLPGGAIHAAVNMAEILQKLDYQLEVISREEGLMRETFEALGIPVSIQKDMASPAWLLAVTGKYDGIFVNSITMYDTIADLNHAGVKAYWWIHEPPAYFGVLEADGKLTKDFWDSLGSGIAVFAAGDFVCSYIKERFQYKPKVLNFGIEDVSGNCGAMRFAEINPDKVTFIVPSMILNEIKGQDIMVAAVTELAKEYMDRAEFLFFGVVEAQNGTVYDAIMDAAGKFDNVKFYNAIRREYLLQAMKQADCIVAPSREDATNACIVEGLMLSKLCLCSDRTGISRYMEDFVNGFIFRAGDAWDLRARIMLVIDNFGRLAPIAENGRNVYETHFSMEVFERHVEELFL